MRKVLSEGGGELEEDGGGHVSLGEGGVEETCIGERGEGVVGGGGEDMA